MDAIETIMDIFRKGKMLFKEIPEGTTAYDDMVNWARTHYIPFDSINGTWHPIVQTECVKINLENSAFTPFQKWMEQENDS